MVVGDGLLSVGDESYTTHGTKMVFTDSGVVMEGVGEEIDGGF